MIKYRTGVSEAPAHQCKSHAIRCFLMQLFCRSWERPVITGAEVVAAPFFMKEVCICQCIRSIILNFNQNVF